MLHSMQGTLVTDGKLRVLRTPLLGNFISKPSTVWILYKYHTVGHYNRSANSENESQEMKTEDATGNPILIFWYGFLWDI